MHDIILIGGGIVGVSTALWLQRDGHQVTLLDAEGPAARASWGNAGLLAATAYLPVTGPGLLAKAPAMLLDPNQPLFLRWSYLPRLLPWQVPFLRNANARDTARIAAGLVPMVADTLDEHLALSAGTPAARYVVPCDYVYVYDHRKDFEKEAGCFFCFTKTRKTRKTKKTRENQRNPRKPDKPENVLKRRKNSKTKKEVESNIKE